MMDKIAVVTGAGGTLCSAMAKALAAQGWKVALLGRTLSKLEKTHAEIDAAGGTAICVLADVSSEAEVTAAKEEVEAKLGVATLLINGAGGNQSAALPDTTEFDARELEPENDSVKGFFNLSMETFRSVIEINTMGTVIPCFVFGKAMAAEGRGNIINFASMTSFRPITRVAAYAMAKNGIVSFTQWLAAYLAPAGIRVNAIAPGFFLNERSRQIMFHPDGSQTVRAQNILRQTPLKRFGEAEELIGTMNWLISDENAGFVTGITVPVDGGFLSSPGV
ncbi:SDR family oxidoreductase [Neolewinella lacunae]|uniref:SDR family oxidoreductase n=1 Tax=Neolewinella lacunae TaxID=1517758 RepID=A0A923PJC5_9BACT|nr:SDR family oxidoreductase [Neolewinella lacunae]MBC6995145.1 SDR family oxidoreductase [Neolewinella lacunae]MDN3634095.1 SDR family oxidoreductase [Neolewinella lacunae]